MKTIHKYGIGVRDQMTIEMPVGAEIISIQLQGSNICIWAIVDEEESMTVLRHFKIFGTGHDINSIDALKYLSTVQEPTDSGAFVWHVFEKISV